jgi:hypothetical protein
MALAITTIGCESSPKYRGDGSLLDRGPLNFAHGFEVTVGPVDLAKSGHFTFRASGLPTRQFAVGLQVNDPTCAALRSDAQVTLTVTNERGEVVIHEMAPLTSLTWAQSLDKPCQPAFGYFQGRHTEKRLPNGDTCARPIMTGADGGTGSYFDPREAGSYQITVDVTSNSPSLPIAYLVLDDSGSPAGEQSTC